MWHSSSRQNLAYRYCHIAILRKSEIPKTYNNINGIRNFCFAWFIADYQPLGTLVARMNEQIIIFLKFTISKSFKFGEKLQK